ncbi:hypothetical protein [Streptomyces chryseus]
MEKPRVDMRKEEPAAPARSAEDTAVLRPVRDVSPAEETAVLRPVRDAAPAEETTVLPQVRDTAPADETAVLPSVRDEPSDRVPPGFFRDERSAAADAEGDGGNERTRELPWLDPEAAHPATGQTARAARRRSDWAEETPLDDLPSLADELLGGRDTDEDDTGGRGHGGRR